MIRRIAAHLAPLMRRRSFVANRTALQARLAAVVSVAILAVTCADGIGLRDMRRQTIDGTQAAMSNLSRSLAGRTQDIFQTLDTILIGLRERVLNDGTAPAALVRLDALLALRARSLSLVHSLAFIDADGIARASSASGASVRWSSLAFFRHHKDHPGGETFIGWPIQDRSDGPWILTVSRRVDDATGHFAGVVVASVSTAFFRQIFAPFDTGRDGAILLARSDGVLLSRWPMKPSDEGRDIRGGELFRRVLRPGDQPRVEHRSLIDGRVRLGSYHWVADAPVFVLAASSKAEVLAGWWRDVWMHMLALAAIVATLALLARRLWTKIGEGEAARLLLLHSNTRLARSEATKARANGWLEMAEQVAQVGHWNFDVLQNHLTWSEEVYRIHGVNRQTFGLTLDSALAAYHPLDRDMMADLVARSLRDGVPYEVTSRLIRSDGGTRHVLSRGVPQIDEAGTTTALFGVTMDITRQKRAELALMEAHASAEAANQALEAANRALETMAMQDALTGLSNRRHFDRALDQEFRRAMRSQDSVALVLMDIDHFRAFNERYGHQAGDICLRAIAGLISPLLNRPGDVAARYGGGEMALLLPGNIEAGAFAIASRVADAVRELRIPHAGSPQGVVTISMGIEAFVPGHQLDRWEQLVERADRALTAAKSAGRDRVLCCRSLAQDSHPVPHTPSPATPRPDIGVPAA